MPRSPRLLPLFLCILWAAPVSAFEFDFPWIDAPASLQLTLKSRYDYHDDNLNKLVGEDDDYHYLHNSLNLKFNLEGFSFSTRFDTAHFFSTPTDYGQEKPYLNRFSLEKITGAYAARSWKVTAGDFYATIGRGLALNIRKTDLLGEDNTLLGGRFDYLGDVVSASVFSGLTNINNTDLYLKSLVDPYDLISAATVDAWVTGGLKLGAHGVGILFDPLGENAEAATLPEATGIAGVSLELPAAADLVDLYAEANWMGRRLDELNGGDLRTGWAAYASANFYTDQWTILIEGKSYRDWFAYTETPADAGHVNMRVPYVRPPTLEPENMEVENNTDVSGGRLKIAYRPGGADTLLFASYAGFWAKDGSAGNRWIYNLNAGAEQDFLKTGRAKAMVGLREEHPLWDGAQHYHLIYVDASLEVPLTSHHSLDLHGTNWLVHKHLNVGDTVYDSDYIQGDWTLGWKWSPWLAASIVFGYDTSPSAGEGGVDTSIFYDGDGVLQRQLFLAGSLSVDLWGHAVIRLLVGQLRGGPLCVDGVCRVLPPFAGVRAETTLRF